MRMKLLVRDLLPPILFKSLGNYNKQVIQPAKDNLGINKTNEATGLDLIRRDPDRDKVIYVHIHKCAGTSIRKTLGEYPNFVCCVARPGNFPSRLSRNYIDDSIWQNSFKFTFVRNPYSRIVSVYKMFRKFKSQKSNFENFEEFIDFIRWCNVEQHLVESEIPLDIFSNRIENIIHHCSSFHNPKYKIDEMDFIGKVETVNQDIEYIAKKLGKENIVLPAIKCSESR